MRTLETANDILLYLAGKNHKNDGNVFYCVPRISFEQICHNCLASLLFKVNLVLWREKVNRIKPIIFLT